MPMLETSKIATRKIDIRPNEGVFFSLKPASLYLSDGKKVPGFIPEWQSGVATGEVVFNTGMTGYVESLTDPSYSDQILVFTYPLIGNYGVQLASAESEKIQVRGVVVSEAVENFSHSGAEYSLLDWLKSQSIPLLSGVDTRALTKHLRTLGTMQGAISEKAVNTQQLIPTTVIGSASTITEHNTQHTKKIILVDCGAKENILRSLMELPVQIKRVPCDYDYTNESYDGVFLSNGPGDPTAYTKTISITRMALAKDKAVFGICLGSQIMALAAGAKTYKLPYGHRGHNQPCIDTTTKRCYITSQNHGYAIDEKSLGKDWAVSFRNLNDNSVEGIKHKTKPFFSVQFHPEACPGPTDTAWFFEVFQEAL